MQEKKMQTDLSLERFHLPIGLMLSLLLLSLCTYKPMVWSAENHDIAITTVVRDKPMVLPSMDVRINVTVENQGTTVESFNVTVYATNIVTNETITIQSTAVDLAASQNETLEFVWDIKIPWAGTIFPPPWWVTDPMVADFTVWAEASVVDGEIDTADNVYTDGNVRIILLFGDVDGNGVVNIFDIVMLAGGYGAEVGDPRYDPLMDHNQDGVINIFDIVPCAIAYGTRYF